MAAFGETQLSHRRSPLNNALQIVAVVAADQFDPDDLVVVVNDGLN